MMAVGRVYNRGCEEAVEFLDDAGAFKLANDVRGLMRSYAAVRVTASVAHKDNLELRRGRAMCGARGLMLSPELIDALIPHCAVRGIAAGDLALSILVAVVCGEIVDAVLDDADELARVAALRGKEVSA